MKKRLRKDEDLLQIPNFLKRSPTESKIQSNIQIYLTSIRGKVRLTLYREFNSVLKARRYLRKFIGGKDKVKSISSSGSYITLRSGIRLSMNYPYKGIMAKKSPRGKLYDISDCTTRRYREIKTPVKKGPGEMIKTKTRKDVNFIPLKTICRDNDIDPRKARIVLRRAGRDGKLKHDFKGRWEFRKNDVAEILTILEGMK